MSEPVIAGRKPCLVRFSAAGETMLWCSCGRSARQPYCDGSHSGTTLRPVRITAKTVGEEALLCVCKHTKNPPYCDGTHNNLGEIYETASDEEIARTADIGIVARSQGAHGKALLDGGCCVLTPDPDRVETTSGWRISAAISLVDGSTNLSLFQMIPGKAASPAGFGDSQVVLFVLTGAGVVDIAGKKFPAPTHSSIALRPGERFAFHPDAGGAVLIATVCPHAKLAFGAGGAAFDERFPDRVGVIDETARQSMGDRFYQVLTTPESGADQITQFIGEIPLSRAAAHRHLYEEAIVILSGAGYMWTQTLKAAVQPGDIIFLPRKQLHSLECTDPSGMRLAGSFFPAGSPAINY